MFNRRLERFIKEAREEYGITQEELARRIHTTKSVISRMVNHSEDMRVSTFEEVAKALEKKV